MGGTVGGAIMSGTALFVSDNKIYRTKMERSVTSYVYI